MRASRFSILSSPTGIVHLFWKCHNSEYLLNLPNVKKLFFDSLIFGLKHRGTDNRVKLHAFCLMGNHVHQQMSFEGGAQALSHYMRVAHGRFGRLFNTLFRRSGKVANERPKTPLIGDSESQMRVHFYIEANPIRARMVKAEKLRFYIWNSYRYYAHGEVDDWTAVLTPPQWYMELGTNSEDRRRAYRKLFRQYLEQALSTGQRYLKRFIGTALWIKSREDALRDYLKSRCVTRDRAAPS